MISQHPAVAHRPVDQSRLAGGSAPWVLAWAIIASTAVVPGSQHGVSTHFSSFSIVCLHPLTWHWNTPFDLFSQLKGWTSVK